MENKEVNTEPKYKKLDTISNEDYERFLKFTEEYNTIFTKESKYNYICNFKEITELLEELMIKDDKNSYINLVEKCQYFISPENSSYKEAEYVWEMTKKYNGEPREATDIDYRKWKISKVLDD